MPVDLIIPGFQVAGSAMVAIALIRFVRWAIEFAWGRSDLRMERVDKRERDMEARINIRLAIVESELGVYREATMVLVEALSKRDPSNPALLRVAHLLRSAILLPNTNNPEFDELIDKLKSVP